MVVCSKVECVEYLLDQGADVFAVDKNQRRSAIHYAVMNGHSNVLKLLLSDNAKVHTEDGQVPLRDVCIHDMSGQCRCAPPHFVSIYCGPLETQGNQCPVGPVSPNPAVCTQRNAGSMEYSEQYP